MPAALQGFRAGAQKVYLCKKGHNYGPHFLVRSTPLIIKKCCCRVWGVALYLKSLLHALSDCSSSVGASSILSDVQVSDSGTELPGYQSGKQFCVNFHPQSVGLSSAVGLMCTALAT